MHRHQRKVKLAGHYSARSAGRKQRAHDGPMSSRPAQVHAHQHRHDHADDHSAQRQQNVLDADNLVIEAEDVFANETLWRLVTMHNVVTYFGHRVLLQVKGQENSVLRKLILIHQLIFSGLKLVLRHCDQLAKFIVRKHQHVRLHFVVIHAAKLCARQFVLPRFDRSEMNRDRHARHQVLLESQLRHPEAMRYVL